MKASVYTFGCKLNQYESEALAAAFRDRGFTLVSVADPADVYVVNTCTVTSKSDQKARRLIRKLSREHPGVPVVVTGCYAQLNRPELEALGGNIRVVSQEDKSTLLDLPGRLAAGESVPEGGRSGGPFAYRVDRFSFHSRGFLKIQDGCDGACAYCRVPLARGASVSLAAREAVARLGELEQAGYREVVLTGVNISDYRGGLAALLQRMLAETSTVRLRLSSLEPECITEELAEALAAPRIRPHFHIPVQAGSDAVLQRMRRRYTSAVVEEAVARLRRAKGDPFVAADLIVGFPGESEEDFSRTRELVERLEPAGLHVFPFSPRPGTVAVTLRPRVPERTRDRRAGELLALGVRLQRRYAERRAGGTVEAVLEQPLPGAGALLWRGLTENYLQVEVEGVPSDQARAGGLVEVQYQPPKGTDRAGTGRYVRFV